MLQNPPENLGILAPISKYVVAAVNGPAGKLAVEETCLKENGRATPDKLSTLGSKEPGSAIKSPRRGVLSTLTQSTASAPEEELSTLILDFGLTYTRLLLISDDTQLTTERFFGPSGKHVPRFLNRETSEAEQSASQQQFSSHIAADLSQTQGQSHC